MRELISRRGVVGLLAAAGALMLISAGRPWVTAVLSQVPGQPSVSVSGRAAAPGAVALGFVALAGAVVVATAGRTVIRVTAVALAIAGAGAAAVTVLSTRVPARAVASAATRASGVSEAVVASVSRTVWPLVATLAGLLVLLAAVVALREAGRWTDPRRFRRPGDAGAAAAGGTASAGPQDQAGTPHEAALDTWDALSRGEDPT